MSRRRDRPSPSPPARIASPNIGLAAAIIAGAALIAYANTLSAPFIFDDTNAITHNPSIRSWSTALFPPVAAGSAAGRPLVNLSFALNYALGGERVEGYHVVNLLIHLAAGLTLFGLVRRTLLQPLLRERWGAVAFRVAFFSALLWTVHPLLTESVTCLAQRSESLLGLWFLLMFYCLVRAAEPEGSHRWLAGSFVACLFGMFTKEVMVVAPVLAVFFHVLLIDGSWRAAWMRHRRFFLLLAATWGPLVFLVWQNRTRDGAAGFGLGISSWDYALTQCRAIIHYLALSFWPHPLVMDYGRTVAQGVGEVWPQMLLLAMLAGITVAAVLKKVPAAFAGVWFFAILAPSSSVVPLITQTIAEHRMYLPLAGVIVLTVTGAHALAGRRSFIALAAIAVVLMMASMRRNEVYRTALSAWGDVVAKAPDNPRALNNLGNLLDDAGQPDEALRHYQHALAIQPDDAMAHYNVANTLAHRNQLPEAIDHYRESLRLDPKSADTHLNLGNTYALQAHWAEAETEFAAALRLNPGDPLAHNNRGNALSRLGRQAEAVQEYAAALRGMADDPAVHFNLATALAADGQMPEAIRHFQITVHQQPARADAHFRLGVLLVRENRREEGVAELRQALRLKPDYAQAREALAQLGVAVP